MSENAIRTARIAKGWSQARLAVMVGVARTTVARWESEGDNSRKVDPPLVPAVSAALGVPGNVIRPDLAGFVGGASE